MSRSFLTIILLSAACFIYGQAPVPFPKNQIKFSPLRLIDPISGIELSYERVYETRIAGLKYISTQLSAARIQNIFYVKGPLTLEGYRISVEQKGFFKETKREKEYLSVEFVYLNGRYTDHLSREDTANRRLTFDTISVVRQTASINFKYGVQFIFKPFIIDFSVGVGFKYRLVTFYDVEPSDLPLAHPRRASMDFNFDHNARKEGTSYTMNLPINIKLGITF